MITQHQVIIRAAMKRLVDQYAEEDIRRYIERYYLDGFAEKKGYPLSFCSKNLQEQLIEGRRLPINEVERWIQNSFDRGDDIEPPWPECDDAAVARAILLNPMSMEQIVDEYSV